LAQWSAWWGIEGLQSSSWNQIFQFSRLPDFWDHFQVRLKEVDFQNDIITKVFERMNVVHKFLLIDFKWNRVNTLAFNLVSRSSDDVTDHIEFL
jgi:hypothetical protein